MKRIARRLIATACCLLAIGTLTFPLELGATLTQPRWSPPDPGAPVPKPAPAPFDPNEKEEDASPASGDEEAGDSQKPSDPGKSSPSPTPARPDGAER